MGPNRTSERQASLCKDSAEGVCACALQTLEEEARPSTRQDPGSAVARTPECRAKAKLDAPWLRNWRNRIEPFLEPISPESRLNAPCFLCQGHVGRRLKIWRRECPAGHLAQGCVALRTCGHQFHSACWAYFTRSQQRGACRHCPQCGERWAPEALFVREQAPVKVAALKAWASPPASARRLATGAREDGLSGWATGTGVHGLGLSL
uniref:Uncharacterized protein n=1 Tax=Alexandrium monilatum TaxID=311494 RepID=A0A7S4VL53_9DINO